MRTRLTVMGFCLAGCLLLTSQANSQKLDLYGDPLPPGAVVRLGTKRLQTKGGFGWTPDGKSLATLRGGTVYFWDLEDGHCRETLLVPVNPDPFYTYGTKFVLSKDGQRLICADFYGAIATWNLATSEMASQPGGDKRSHEENLAVALHPDGKQFVTLRQSGELEFRDFATCKVLRTIKLRVPRWSGTTAAFSPDGKTLALRGSGNAIYLVDVGNAAEHAAVEKAHGFSLSHLDFLADGRLFSFGTRRGPAATADDPQRQNQLLIWDVSQQPPTSRELKLADELPVGCSVAFSADAKTLVMVYDDRIVIWDAGAEKIVRTIEGPKFRNAMDAIVQVDPLGKYVAIDDRQNYVRIWELATGKPVLSTEQHHQGGVFAADWSPTGERIATGDFTGEVRVWDAASGKPLLKFRGPDWGVFSLRYLSDGRQIVLCGDQPGPFVPKVGREVSGPVRWHDAASGILLREESTIARARLLTPAPDGTRLAIATNTVEAREVAIAPPAIRLLDGTTGKEIGKFDLDKSEATALAWSADGQTIFAADSTKVLQIDAQTLKSTAEVVLPHLREDFTTKLLVESGWRNATFLRHGAGILTAGELSEFYGWKLPGGEKQWTIKTDDRFFRKLVPSPDERMLAVLCETADRTLKLRLFDMSSRRPITSFDLGRESADRAVFSPDGNRILVGFYDGTALVYDVSEVR
jgi:WD40 repeat protein